MQNTKKKILLCIDSLKFGGAERQFVELLRQLSQNIDYQIVVLVFNSEIHFNEIEKFNLKLYKLDIKKKISFLLNFNKIVVQVKPNIIHSWSLLSTTYSLIYKIFHRGVKVIDGSIRSSYPLDLLKWKLRLLSIFNYKFSDIIVANSQAGLISNGIQGSKCKVVHNGLSFSRFANLADPEDLRKNLGLQDQIVIGMVANFSIYKDYDTFFNVSMKLLTKHTNIKFIVVGYGPTMDFYIKKINPTHRDKFIFLGKISLVDEIINIFDIALLTSFREGLPNAVMEYMALGKAVVTSGSGGFDELIPDSDHGFALPTGDIEGVVEIINILIEDSTMRRKIGMNAKKKIERDFSVDKMYHSYLNIYELLEN